MAIPLEEEIEEARAMPRGWVYRIAGNFDAADLVPPEAIVGAWKVDEAGVIVGGFVPNTRYDADRWPAKDEADRPDRSRS